MTNIGRVSPTRQPVQIEKSNKPISKAEESLLSQNGYNDSVELSKSEKFNEVFQEFEKNVPDQTSTIEEKELAISYINRMLACDDISDDLKIYWQNKKEIIEMEIQNIKNREACGTNEKYEDILKELNDFTAKYQNYESKQFLTDEDRIEYWRTYNNTCISFYKRALNAPNINEENKAYCLSMINLHIRDNNNLQVDLNNLNKENGKKTESYNDVFNEFRKNVPDQTSTIDEKELAISYINRLLSCDDISDDLKIYWQNKKEIIEMEIQNIKNEEALELGEKFDTVFKEYNEFKTKYDKLITNDELSSSDKLEYYQTYATTLLSFANRFEKCEDLPWLLEFLPDEIRNNARKLLI